MRRPLFTMLTGLVLGEAVTCVCGERGICITFLFMLTLLILYTIRQDGPGHLRSRRFVLLLMAGFSFFGSICYMADASLPDWEKQSGLLTGVIVLVRKKPDRSMRLVVKDISLSRTGKRKSRIHSFKGQGRVQVYISPAPDVSLLPDDKVEIPGEMLPLTSPTNPGEFDSKTWYQAQGIRGIFMADSVRRIFRPAVSIQAAAWRIRERISQSYRRVLSREDAALLNAMALGDKSDLGEEQRASFAENGVAHLLAVSGLHVSILGGCLFTLLKRKGAGYLVSCLAGSSVLIFYVCMTGFGSSAMRAVIMYLVYLLAQYLGADYDILSAMSLSGILMLTEYPKRLMEGGFQISYLSILAIGGVLPLAEELYRRRLSEKEFSSVKNKIIGMDSSRKETSREDSFRKEPSRKDSFRKEPSGWNLFGKSVSCVKGKLFGKKDAPGRKAADRVKQSLFSGMVISGVTAPVLMRLFYEWSPLSILLNLILLPCMVPLMISAVCGGMAGLFSSAAARLMLIPAEGILSLFYRIFDMTDRLPGKRMITGCPTILQMICMYGMIALVFFIFLYPGLMRVMSLAFLVVLTALHEFTGSVSTLVSMQDSGLMIDMLDVGQGECILLRTPDRRTILMDGGSTSKNNVGRYVIIPALKYYGVKKIDYMVASHMDADHISGLTELLDTGFPVEHLLLPDAGKKDPTRISFRKLAEKSGIDVIDVRRGDRMSYDALTLTCLHPAPGYEPADRNDTSVVMHLSWRKFDMLFTGDLGEEGEKVLLSYIRNDDKGDRGNDNSGDRRNDNSGDRGNDDNRNGEEDGKGSPLKSLDVLKVAHHGSMYSTDEGFLSCFPDIQAALISAGQNNRYGHPHKELLSRLAKRNMAVYITKELGAIHLKTDGDQFTVKGYLEQAPRYPVDRE